jgi:hypothetical protein
MSFSNRLGLRILSAAALLAVASFFGCGDDGDGGASPDLIVLADFEGNWVAASYRVTSVANPIISLDLIPLGGAFGWEADDEGNFAGRNFIPASIAGATLQLPFQGNFTLLSQDSIMVTFTPEIEPFLTNTRAAFTLSGDNFTITDGNTTFDFGMGQGEEPALFEGTLTRYTGPLPSVIFVEDFQGVWEAQTYTLTAKANPQRTAELIAAGATFEFTVDSMGGLVGDAFIPAAVTGDQDVQLNDFLGYFELVKQDTIRTVFTPEVPPFLTNTYGWFSISGDILNIKDENGFFDFGGGEGAEPVIFEAVVERQNSGK